MNKRLGRTMYGEKIIETHEIPVTRKFITDSMRDMAKFVSAARVDTITELNSFEKAVNKLQTIVIVCAAVGFIYLTLVAIIVVSR